MDIVHSIVVQNSLHDVFAYLSDLKNRKTFSSQREVAVQEDIAKKGAKYFEWFRLLGRRQQFRFMITQLIPNEAIKAKNTDNGFPMEEIFEVKEEETGTRIFWRVHVEPKGFSKMLSPVIKSNISRQISQQMRQLKDTLDFSFMQKNTLDFAFQNDKYWL